MKVFVTNPIPEIGIQLLKNAHFEILQGYNDTTISDWESLCHQADVLLNVGYAKFDKAFFEKFKNIKAIALFSVGYDSVDVHQAYLNHILVGNTPDVLSKATSDISFLLMQSVARRMNYNLNKVKDGTWDNFDALEAIGQELYGKTIGIFGLGRIGFEMAKKCKYAFDMNVIYHNRNRNLQAEKDLEAEYVTFAELVEQSDVLSVHANYTKEKAGIFNKEVFGKMKSNAIFVNTARGGFHNEEDLYQALINENIWGAGLDVTNPEPMIHTNKLLDLPTVCVLPHIGSATIEARNGMAKRSAENLIAFSKSEKMPYCINPEVYSV